MNGYASRLHYTRDWLNENIRAGRLWEPGLPQTFAVQEQRTFNFMTKRASQYPHIKGHEQKIKEIEMKLSSQPFVYVPKAKVKEALQIMQNGDFIALVDRRQGIDFSHVGLYVKDARGNGFLHASSTKNQVMIQPDFASFIASGNAPGFWFARSK